MFYEKCKINYSHITKLCLLYIVYMHLVCTVHTNWFRILAQACYGGIFTLAGLIGALMLVQNCFMWCSTLPRSIIECRETKAIATYSRDKCGLLIGQCSTTLSCSPESASDPECTAEPITAVTHLLPLRRMLHNVKHSKLLPLRYRIQEK